jgi:hypothetical protein
LSTFLPKRLAVQEAKSGTLPALQAGSLPSVADPFKTVGISLEIVDEAVNLQDRQQNHRCFIRYAKAVRRLAR